MSKLFPYITLGILAILIVVTSRVRVEGEFQALHEFPREETSVYFATSSDRVLFSDDCVNLVWHIYGINSVYVSGLPRAGEGEEERCGVNPQVSIELTDGTTVEYNLPRESVIPLPRQWLILGLLALVVGNAAWILRHKSTASQESTLRKFALLTFTILGGALIASIAYQPALSLTWMFVYQLSDFTSFRDMLETLGNLRIPIPPYLFFLEVSSNLLNLDTLFIVKLIYQLSLFVPYLIVLLRIPGKRIIWSTIISLIFVQGTVLIHVGNAQYYDLLYPLYILGFIYALQIGSKCTKIKHLYFWCFAAGLMLTLSELTRPFVLFLLPILLIYAYFKLNARHNRRAIFALLIPVILFSGTWHLYLLAAHGQTTLSNHSGFNLYRNWSMVPRPDLIVEDDTRLGPDRYPNTNNDQHIINSQRLQTAIVGYIIKNPLRSLHHLTNRTLEFFEPQVILNTNTPKPSWMIALYILTVRVVAFYFLFQLLLFLRHLLNSGWRSLRVLLRSEDNFLLIITALTIFVFIAGERGEDARFLISVLPLLAVLPRFQPEPTQNTSYQGNKNNETLQPIHEQSL